MNEAYWDNVAASYEDDIFSVLDHDRAGRLRDLIAREGRPDHTAADLGCGIGKFTPLLAAHFGQVQAYDLSAKLLARARKRCAAHDNIVFAQVDLAAEPTPHDPADFALCVNVLIMPSLDVRLRAWREIAGHVKRGGLFALVVPSAESMLLTQQRLLYWHVRDGTPPDEATRCFPRHGSARQLLAGIFPIEGVPTKHYVREELEALFQQHEFERPSFHKLPYPWSTEFVDAPEWMQAPYPWDWLALGRRR